RLRVDRAREDPWRRPLGSGRLYTLVFRRPESRLARDRSAHARFSRSRARRGRPCGWETRCEGIHVRAPVRDDGIGGSCQVSTFLDIADARGTTPTTMEVSPEAGHAHSMSRLARNRSDGGMVRPRTFAVFRLMVRSNFVG